MKIVLTLILFASLTEMISAQDNSKIPQVQTSPPTYWYEPRPYPLSPEPYIMPPRTPKVKASKGKSVDYYRWQQDQKKSK